MNAKWFLEMSVHYGNFCVAQGKSDPLSDIWPSLTLTYAT